MSCTIIIQLNDAVNIQADDVTFWLSQFAEDADLLARLLNVAATPKLKAEAAELALKFREAAALGVNQCDMGLLLKFYAFLIHLKMKIDFIPQIVLAIRDKHLCHLIKHMLFQLTYFVRLSEGKVTVWEDISFWILEAIDHLYLMSSLMGDHEHRKNLRKLAKGLKALLKMAKRHPKILKVLAKELLMHGEVVGRVRDLARAAAIRLDYGLVMHEMRETDRGIQRINFFVSKLALLQREKGLCKELFEQDMMQKEMMHRETVVTIERM